MSSPSAKGLPAIRRTTFFSGRVQGVGFRYTTGTLASRFPVTGCVRNLSDGRVKLVTEGLTAELDRFEAAVSDALGEFIQEARSTESAATGEFDSFSIAF